MAEELVKQIEAHERENAQAGQTASTEIKPPETNTSSFVELVKGLGFENVADEKEAFTRLLEAYKQKDETTKALSQQVAQVFDEVRQLQNPQTAQTQQKSGDKWWSPPEIDTSLASKYRNADGSWRPETPSGVKQAVEQAEAYYDKWANDLVRQPDKVLPKIIRQEAEAIVRELMSQTSVAQREAQAQERVFEGNPWLFEKNPISGQVDRGRLSAEGQLLNQHFIVAQEKGLSFEDAWDYAYSKHQLAKLMAGQKADEGQSVADVNARKKKELLERASNANPQRGGSLPAATAQNKTQNKNLTFGERFRRQAQADGVKLG